jgi:hypothetical protein
MRTPSLVAAVSAAALLPALALVPAATAAPAAKALKVTINDLPVSSDVGTKLTVAGTAKDGKKKVKVTVQRRYGAGAWQTVGTDTTDKKGKYSLKVALVQGGPTSFRTKVGSRTSKVESLAVYEWLDLVDQSIVAGANGAMELRRTASIDGRRFPGSIVGSSGGLTVVAKPSGLCTTFEMWSGFLDEDAEGQLETARQAGGMSAYAAGPTTPQEFSVPVGPAVRQTLALTGARYLYVQLGTQQADGAAAVMAGPRVRCNAASLPEMRYDEIGA